MSVQYSMKTALKQIASCDFECEAGPLKNNVGWRWLEAASQAGPEFYPGQWIWFEVEAEAAGKKLTQWVTFCIVGCHMDSDSERQFWRYDLSWDPPQAYHAGKVHFTNIRSEKLLLERPANG